MLRGRVIPWQRRRLIGCAQEFSASATASRLSSNSCSEYAHSRRRATGPPQQFRVKRVGCVEGRGASLGATPALLGMHGAISRDCLRALASGRMGARRSIWTPWGGGGSAGGKTAGDASGGSDTNNDEGFSETMGGEGDSWTPPPDAWKPDEPSAADPQDAVGSSISGFDIGDGFSQTVAGAAAGAAAAAPEAASAVTAAGLSAADLSLYYPHHLFMKIIETVHATAGVPYWEAIIITSLAARFAVLPMFMTFQGMAKRMQMARPEVEELQSKIKEIQARVEANPEIKEAATQEMGVVSHQMLAVLRSHRVSYPKMMLSMMGQLPVFVSLFIATREMGNYFPGYATGGLEWMSNLAVPDPTHTLPVLTCASMMILMEIGGDVQSPQQAGKPAVNMKHIFRAMSIVFIPVAFTMPSGVLIYWTTTNVFGLLQRAVFHQEAVQKFLGWPLPGDIPVAKTPEEPKEADFVSKDDLDRWAGGGHEGSSEAAREAAERARDAVAKASRERHEELKREHGNSRGDESSLGAGRGSGDETDKRQ